MAQEWQQLPGEGPKAFDLFRRFLDLGPERQLQPVIEWSQRPAKVIYKLSRKFHWPSRARSFDRWLVQAEDAAVKRTLEQDAILRAKRRIQFREKAHTAVEKAMEQVYKILDYPIEKVEETTEEVTLEPDGTHVHRTTIIVTPMKAHKGHAAQLMKAAAELSKVSCDSVLEDKLLGKLGSDIRGDLEERVTKARTLLIQLQDEYANRPEILVRLPLWLATQWGIDQQLLFETNEPLMLTTQQEELSTEIEQ